MKIVIDEKICKKHHLSVTEVLVSLGIRSSEDVNETLNELEEKQVLVYKDNNYMVTQPWSDILDEILCDSCSGEDNEERLTELAKKMRECFPEGKMPGTAYYYRCNVREVVLKLKKFFLQYGNYSDDKIIDATKRFIEAYNGNYRYLPLIKYFISKNKTITDEDGTSHIQEVSELASYLENKETETKATSDDWLMSARN